MDLGSPIYELPAIKKTVSGRQYACKPRPTYPPNSVQELRFWDESNGDNFFEPDIFQYLPLLKPKLTRKGKVAGNQPYIINKPLEWWKAQCGFRGLPMSGSLADLQNRIRGLTGQTMCPLIAMACEEMEADYLTQNKDVVDKKWNLADDNEKARLWPQRLLSETFLVPSAPKEVLVVQVDEWPWRFEEICGQMNILCETRNTPFSERGQMGLRKIAVGLDPEVVGSKYAELDREAKRLILREREEREERHKKADEPFFEKLDLARTRTKEPEGEWDISGKWIINCPYMEENWGSEGQKCSIEFEYTKPDALGSAQLYGNFDFIALAGILRVVDPDYQSSKPPGSISSQQQALAIEDNQAKEEEEPTYNEDEEDHETLEQPEGEVISPAQFILPSTSMPSAKCRKFGFRWRGNETGEGEIQGDSEEDLCSITFENPNALSGIFISGLTGEQKFQGFREGVDAETTAVNRKRPYAVDPSEAWSGFGDDLHKRIWAEWWPDEPFPHGEILEEDAFEDFSDEESLEDLSDEDAAEKILNNLLDEFSGDEDALRDYLATCLNKTNLPHDDDDEEEEEEEQALPTPPPS